MRGVECWDRVSVRASEPRTILRVGTTVGYLDLLVGNAYAVLTLVARRYALMDPIIEYRWMTLQNVADNLQLSKDMTY